MTLIDPAPEDRPAPKLLTAGPVVSKTGYGEKRRSSAGWWIAIGLALIFIIAFLAGYLPRRHRQKTVEAAARTQSQALPVVTVAKAEQSPRIARLLLPGDITPITEAFIYARANGYVRKRYVDIGDRVRRGQILAEIDSPDLDQQVYQARAALRVAEQQLRQALADLKHSEAARDFAKVQAARYDALVKKGAVAKQDADTQEANYLEAIATVGISQANVHGMEDNIAEAKANLERMIALQDYEKVRAPFAGLITARNIDIGALISTTGASMGVLTNSGMTAAPSTSGGASGSPASSGSSSPAQSSAGGSTQSGEMFRMAQTGSLRILVKVPQTDAPSIQLGKQAQVLVQELPNRTFTGAVTRTASSLDLTSRTMLTEVQLENRDGVLLPGMYSQVRFDLVRENPPVLVPGDSLITGSKGVQVAVARPEQQTANGQSSQGQPPPSRIHVQDVTVGRDYGAQTEITGGLEPGSYIVVNPSDAVREGALVKTKQVTSGEASQGAPAAKNPGGIGGPSAPPPEKKSGKK